MDRKLIEAMVEAFRESDVRFENDEEPYSYYEEKAKVAIEAYDNYYSHPRPQAFYPEGLVFL